MAGNLREEQLVYEQLLSRHCLSRTPNCSSSLAMFSPSFFQSPLPSVHQQFLALRACSPAEEEPFPPSSLARWQTPSHTPSSLVLTPLPDTPVSGISRSRIRVALFGSPAKEMGKKVDILALLPPEIAVKILSYLRPQDLCQVCLVCHQWYRLAQDGVLKRRRQEYLQTCREDFLQSKENLCRALSTPHSAQQSLSRSMTVAASPLSVIQLKSQRRNSLPSPSSHTSTPHTHAYTPGPVFLLEKLSIHEDEENSTTVRRRLFPNMNSLETNDLLPQNSTLFRHDSESLVGRKANKSRLRRL